MGTKRILVLGSTGRVGGFVLDYALAAGHAVTAFARDPQRVKTRPGALTVVQGDVYEPASVARVLARGFDAVVMVVGADPLKASTAVRDTVAVLTGAMWTAGVERYLGITGTAQMPATPFGRVTQFFVRRFIQAAADHQAAYDLLTASPLDYALAACPYIKDGAHTGSYHEVPGPFPGGFKTISPQDVADFLVKELDRGAYHRRAVGLWY